MKHDALLAQVGRVVKDRRVNRLIHLYLVSGVMVNGVVMVSTLTSSDLPQVS